MTTTSAGRQSLWVTGTALFAATMMTVAGLFQIADGAIALTNDVVLARVGGYLFAWDADVWGWIHILLGAAVCATGLCLLVGKAWARAVGIGLVLLSMLTHFLWLPFYPLASLVVIALDALVVWALSVYQPRA